MSNRGPERARVRGRHGPVLVVLSGGSVQNVEFKERVSTAFWTSSGVSVGIGISSIGFGLSTSIDVIPTVPVSVRSSPLPHVPLVSSHTHLTLPSTAELHLLAWVFESQVMASDDGKRAARTRRRRRIVRVYGMV